MPGVRRHDTGGARCSTCPAPSRPTASTPASPPTTATRSASRSRCSQVTAFVDLSHRDVVRDQRSRPAQLAALADHPAPRAGCRRTRWSPRWCCRPQGHVEHAMTGYDDGEVVLGARRARRGGMRWSSWLDSMRFMLRVEVDDVSDDWAVLARSRDGSSWSGAAHLAAAAQATTGRQSGRTRRCGSRAASRGSDSTPTTRRSPTRSAGSVPAVAPRQGLLPRPGDGRAGAHARAATAPARAAAPRRLGRPPTRHRRSRHAALDGRVVGRVGSAARHYELGPIALALVKRNVSRRRRADGRRRAGEPGGRGRPGGRPARPSAALAPSAAVTWSTRQSSGDAAALPARTGLRVDVEGADNIPTCTAR